VKAKLLCDAGKITDGAAVEIVTKAGASKASEPRSASEEEYTVRDDAGHEESVATRDFQLLP
jgi:hypothetical protein